MTIRIGLFGESCASAGSASAAPRARKRRSIRCILLVPVRFTVTAMCRNIKTLFNFAPAATDEEIYAASLQFVRKLSGYNKPSKANEVAFNRAVIQVAAVARSLIDTLQTTADPRDREVEAARARARAAER